MTSPDLVEYIRTALGKGMSPSVVRERVRAAGWKVADVDAAFAEVQKDSVPSSNQVINPVASELTRIKEAIEGLNNRLLKLEGRSEESGQVQVFERYPESPADERQTAPVREEISEAKETETGGKPESVETKVTGKWFAVVGVVALLFGVGFFLKYAFESNLIGVTGRVIMGVVAGLVLLVLGDFLSRKEKYRQYSFFISAGGLALLYLSIYGAFNFYGLISQPIAFALMVVITAGGVAMAVKAGSEWLSALALIGGFLTPFLISSGVDQQVALFSYILILNLGFLAVSFFKKWQRLYFLTFLGTYLVLYVWMSRFYAPSKLWVTMGFLTAFYAIFLLAPFLRSLTGRQSSDEKDAALSVLNAAAYFATSYGLLLARYEPYLGFFFVLGAVVYLVFATAISTFHREDRFGILALASIGLVLVTLAIPIQLEKEWITVAWAAEGLVLTWVGFRLKNQPMRLFADLVFIVTAIRLLFLDIATPRPLKDFTPFVNDRFLTYLFAIICLFLALYFYRRAKAELTDSERRIPIVIGVAVNLLAVLILSLEATTIFDKQIEAASSVSQPQTVFDNQYPFGPEINGQYAPPPNPYSATTNAKVRDLQNAQNLSLSVIWALYAAVLMVVGIVRHTRYARLLAIVGFAIVVFKVFLFDIAALADIYRILSFITLGVILLVVSFLFYRYKDKIKKFLME